VDCGVADFFLFAVMSTEQNVEGIVRTVGAVAATPGAAGTAVDASAVGGAGPLSSSGASPRDALHRGDDDLELAMSLQLEETEVAAAAASAPDAGGGERECVCGKGGKTGALQKEPKKPKKAKVKQDVGAGEGDVDAAGEPEEGRRGKGEYGCPVIYALKSFDPK
jgi:hypothetical protein